MAVRRMPPQASSRHRCIRQRSSGSVVGGTSEASWAQYSTSRRGRRSRARSSSAGSYDPSREKNGRYWLRDTTLTLSICTTPTPVDDPLHLAHRHGRHGAWLRKALRRERCAPRLG
jgi:hypothetical protein